VEDPADKELAWMGGLVFIVTEVNSLTTLVVTMAAAVEMNSFTTFSSKQYPAQTNMQLQLDTKLLEKQLLLRKQLHLRVQANVQLPL
jgi:hypothetical protein